MVLRNDWGISSTSDISGEGNVSGNVNVNTESRRKEKEDRWRRSWILCESRKAVRRWVEEREKVQGQEEVIT